MSIRLKGQEIVNIDSDADLHLGIASADVIAAELPGVRRPIALWQRPIEPFKIPGTVNVVTFEIDSQPDLEALTHLVERIKEEGHAD